jgi:serine phosphatase RsbU (regulator of sigma subunit)
VLYSDGVTEAANAHGAEYGDERLRSLVACCAGVPARDLVTRCLADLTSFLEGEALSDDLTILALGRSRREVS